MVMIATPAGHDCACCEGLRRIDERVRKISQTFQANQRWHSDPLLQGVESELEELSRECNAILNGDLLGSGAGADAPDYWAPRKTSHLWHDASHPYLTITS